MILKWSSYDGRAGSPGGAREAVNYLIAESWSKNVAGRKVLEVRHPRPEILRGDPELVRRAIEAAPGRLKYSSAVASFHAQDIDIAAFNAGDPALRQAVDDYIEGWLDCAFAGLPRSARPPVLVATHGHAGRLELNFLAPRAVMVGDKLRAHNIAPPGPANRRLWNALTDAHNLKHSWADALDPARERLVRVPDHVLKDARAAGRLALRSQSRKDVREIIADQISRRIDAGEITDRASVVAHLQAAGFQLVRETRKSITIADPNDATDVKKRLRLEGAIFQSDFAAADYLAERRREHAGGATAREMLRDEFLVTAPERLKRELAFRASTNSRLAAEIAAAAPQAEPIDLDADRIHFRRLPEPEPSQILEFSDDNRDPDRRVPDRRVSRRFRDADIEAAHAAQAARVRPPGRGRDSADRTAHAGAYRRADRPGRAPGALGRALGRVPLPDAVLARASRTGAVFVNKDDLRALSRRHLDRRSQISASTLHADAHDFLEQRGPAALAELRRRSQRDRRLLSQSARLAREGWSLEQRTEWKQRYLYRLYCGPPLNAELLKDIRYIDSKSREIQFWDGCTVRDEGDRIVADWATASSIELLVAQARAAGWQSVRFTGRDHDVAALVAEAHRQGLVVDGYPAPDPAPAPTAQEARERPAAEESPPMTPAAPSAPKPRRARPSQFIKDPPGYVDRIRREVDLPALAISYGYEVDREKTSKRWISLRHKENGRRLLMNSDKVEGWRWQDPQTKRGGDAFNLVADARGFDVKRDFGAIKKELAGLVGLTPTDFAPSPPPPPASPIAVDQPRDFSQIREAWEAAGRDPTPAYLTGARGIPKEILTSPRFADSFRMIRSNVAFPYRDAVGDLIGYERRFTPSRPNGPKASYSEGGTAGLWSSATTPDDRYLVVCESPINCMSLDAILPRASRGAVRYAARRSGVEATTALRRAIQAMPAGSRIVGACDHGAAGQRFQDEIRKIAKEFGQKFVDLRPAAKDRDWNDELRLRHLDALKAEQLLDDLDRRAEAAAAPAPAERPAEPAAVQGPEEQRRAEIEELEEDGPAPEM